MMARVSWFWHRLRAMSPAERTLHARKKLRQWVDARRLPDWSGLKLEEACAFPKLPKPADAPEVLREALQRDTENILAGKWQAFGHLDLQVDDPPLWHCDYLVQKNLTTDTSAFKLDHRALPDGADIKLIWELSRWHQLARLAMTAHVLGNARAAKKCIEWLEDWVKHNPPYRGWNWTSALEAGMRLIQFTWIDGLLASWSERAVQGTSEDGRSTRAAFWDRLRHLRQEILPAHVWFVWRHKSFGSSANNHLLGELAGLILATVRWPELAKWGASLDELQRRWETEVLAQFAEDGGNKEQALNYHLFSWELCWQARAALARAGRSASPEVEERLRRAAGFFVDVQVPSDPWDYGDSDNAFVSPMYVDATNETLEWRRWFTSPANEPALNFWWGEEWRAFGLEIPIPKASEWWYLAPSGCAVWQEGDWSLRWDLSSLGYLATAAHGHLDALHLSIWFKGVALIVDPGTGCYYADKKLRNWLASRAAHNAPSPESAESWPKRPGAFLWAQHHDKPVYEDRGNGGVQATFKFPESAIQRSVEVTTSAGRCEVRDSKAGGHLEHFAVRWQFASESTLEILSTRRFRLTRHGVTVEIQVSEDWAEVFPVTEQSQRSKADPDHELAGIISPAFRETVWAPYLKLVARSGDKPCVFRTIFLASAHQ